MKFNGVRELAAFLADSEETHTAFVEQLFHHLVKQPVRAYGPETLPDLRRSFAANEFNIRKLVVEIMATSALTPAKTKAVSSSDSIGPASDLDRSIRYG